MAEVAQVMAPVVTQVSPAPPNKRRKRDVVTGVFKGVVMWVRMAGAVREEAINIVDDTCDVDEPEICTDGEARKGAIRQLSASIFKTARSKLPLAICYLLPTAYCLGERAKVIVAALPTTHHSLLARCYLGSRCRAATSSATDRRRR